jgi:hypothetical protein
MHEASPPTESTPATARCAIPIVRDKGITGPARLLYAVMATHADDKERNGVAGRAALARDFGSSTHTITRLLGELERKGVVSRRERYEIQPSGKRRRTTDEWILLDQYPDRHEAAKNLAKREPVLLGEPPEEKPKPLKADVPTALYRWYDADDLLLYVGITSSFSTRQSRHAQKSSWSEFAVRSAVERFPTRKAALAAEVAAIEAEAPLFNSAFNDTPEARMRVVEYLVEHERLDLLAAAVSRG